MKWKAGRPASKSSSEDPDGNAIELFEPSRKS